MRAFGISVIVSILSILLIGNCALAGNDDDKRMNPSTQTNPSTTPLEPDEPDEPEKRAPGHGLSGFSLRTSVKVRAYFRARSSVCSRKAAARFTKSSRLLYHGFLRQHKTIADPRLGANEPGVRRVRLDLLSQLVHHHAQRFGFLSVIGPPNGLQQAPV
jgi:hypothetical protein